MNLIYPKSHPARPPSNRSSKVVSAAEAVALVGNGDFLAIQGSGGGVGEPTAILRAMRERFLKDSSPRSLTLCHATGLGDKNEIGTDLLALDGLVKRDIAGHLGMAPIMGQMILDDRIEAYNFPQGVISHMFSAVAGRKPGVLTKVGLHTYVDPRLDGGRMNSITTESLVEVVQLADEEWLFFPRFPINVAVIRGTTADTRGNVTGEHEGSYLESNAIAQAARANGGIVIAQVKNLARAGTLDPRQVRVPGVCVDYIVVDPQQQQHCLAEYDPSLCGDVKIPFDSLPPMPLGIRKVIGRRAAQELFPGAVVNLGVGMPDAVAAVTGENGIIKEITFTVEHGLVGGQPAGGIIFGVSHCPEAMICEDEQFSFYDGGNLDLAFLGMAEADAEGNVNSSKVGNLLSGCGGFINITQSAREVVFCGTFTAKGLDVEVGHGKLVVKREGQIRKFVQAVNQITFSGNYARQRKQKVLFVTERAVFRLDPKGLVLTEIAPGIDLKRDVIAHMDFEPHCDPDMKTMNPELFNGAVV
ncbi:acyl CoA:acetate/3-ketoacid CoA transferase [Planctomycetota bacterium]